MFCSTVSVNSTPYSLLSECRSRGTSLNKMSPLATQNTVQPHQSRHRFLCVLPQKRKYLGYLSMLLWKCYTSEIKYQIHTFVWALCNNIHVLITFFISNIWADCYMTWKIRPVPSLPVAYTTLRMKCGSCCLTVDLFEGLGHDSRRDATSSALSSVSSQCLSPLCSQRATVAGV